MTTRKQKGSKILEEKSVGELIAAGLEEFAEELQRDKAGVSKKFTCHKITLDLHPTTYGPETVRQTRQLMGSSQAVFAQFLGVATNTVRAWEQGINQPSDTAARLMDEIRHDPNYWRKRMAEVAVEKSSQAEVIS